MTTYIIDQKEYEDMLESNLRLIFGGTRLTSEKNFKEYVVIRDTSPLNQDLKFVVEVCSGIVYHYSQLEFPLVVGED